MMKLQNKLYDISQHEVGGNVHVFSILLHKDCEIYKAHFPGQAVTPGVCIIQTAKELAEHIVNTRLAITELRNVKFLSVISPYKITNIEYTIDRLSDNEDNVAFRAVVRSKDTIYAKLNLTCSKTTTRQSSTDE